MMEREKKNNKQWRREIIADVNRREAEKRKEKWRLRKCWAVYRQKDFKRRKTEVFPSLLYPSSIRTPEHFDNICNDYL